MAADSYDRLISSMNDVVAMKNSPPDSNDVERVGKKLLEIAKVKKHTGYSLVESFILAFPDAAGTLRPSGHAPSNQNLYDELTDEQRREIKQRFSMKIAIAASNHDALMQLLPALGVTPIS
jgi:hypothetical protein